MKKCRQCEIEKELRFFYVHSAMKDGHLNKCIECVKDRVSIHRSKNITKIRAYDRKRGLTDKRKCLNRKRSRERYEQYKWAKIEWVKQNRIKIRKYKTDWGKRNKIKVNAALKARRAVQKGRIIKLPCEVCGDVRSQGHHDDYSKPLEVRWLCQKHHKELHRIYED